MDECIQQLLLLALPHVHMYASHQCAAQTVKSTTRAQHTCAGIHAYIHLRQGLHTKLVHGSGYPAEQSVSAFC